MKRWGGWENREWVNDIQEHVSLFKNWFDGDKADLFSRKLLRCRFSASEFARIGLKCDDGGDISDFIGVSSAVERLMWKKCKESFLWWNKFSIRCWKISRCDVSESSK